MIAEIPSPDCAGACASGHTEEFRKARAVINALPEQVAGVTVVVTGVGFFDFLHGQTGAAPNGVELHPVLKIEPESDSSLRLRKAYSCSVKVPQRWQRNERSHWEYRRL